MSKIDVILTETVRKLGALGSQVSVKRGYFRHFLFPLGKAVYATPEAMIEVKKREEQMRAEDAQKKEKAERIAELFKGTQLVFVRESSDAGTLYGSVSPVDVKQSLEAQFGDALAEEGVVLSRSSIHFPQAVKMIGAYEVHIELHADVTVTLSVDVQRTSLRGGNHNY